MAASRRCRSSSAFTLLATCLYNRSSTAMYASFSTSSESACFKEVHNFSLLFSDSTLRYSNTRARSQEVNDQKADKIDVCGLREVSCTILVCGFTEPLRSPTRKRIAKRRTVSTAEKYAGGPTSTPAMLLAVASFALSCVL